VLRGSRQQGTYLHLEVVVFVCQLKLKGPCGLWFLVCQIRSFLEALGYIKRLTVRIMGVLEGYGVFLTIWWCVFIGGWNDE
jgi:hypothetical protein